MKIPFISHVLAGQNLEDHPGALKFYESHRNSSLSVEPDYQSKGMFEYIASRTEMYATILASFYASYNTNGKSKYSNNAFKPEIKGFLNKRINETEILSN